MTSFDAFISYPHQNKAAADAACARLEAAGVRCWIAPRDVEPGAEWAGAIVDAIDGCRVMILIFSSHANQSKQIRREVQRAFDMEVPVVPFRIENVVPEKSLAYFMGPVHWLDALTPPLELHLQKLVISVKALVQARTASAAPEAGPSPRSSNATSETDESRAAGPQAPEKEDLLAVRQPATEPPTGFDKIAPFGQPKSPLASIPEAPEPRPTIKAAAGAVAAFPNSEATLATRTVIDHTTTFFIWLGTFLLAWWLVGASRGPAAFANIAWLTNSLVGQLILAFYPLSVLLQSINRVLHLMRSGRPDLDKSEHTHVGHEDLVVVANGPFIIAFLAIVVAMFDTNQAAVVQRLSSPIVTVPMLLFAVTIAVQMRTSAQAVVDSHLRGGMLRQVFGMTSTSLAITAAVTMIYAIIRASAY